MQIVMEFLFRRQSYLFDSGSLGKELSIQLLVLVLQIRQIIRCFFESVHKTISGFSFSGPM